MLFYRLFLRHAIVVTLFAFDNYTGHYYLGIVDVDCPVVLLTVL